jgi:hypothetical protein
VGAAIIHHIGYAASGSFFPLIAGSGGCTFIL